MDQRRRERAIDLALCGVLLIVALPPAFNPDVNDPAATVAGPLLLPTLLLPLLWRRQRPLAAACWLAVACVVSALPTFNQFRLLVAIPVALLVLAELASRSPLRPAVAGLAVVVAGLTFVGATEAVATGVGGTLGLLGFAVPVCLAVWGAGRLAWSRDRIAQQLTDRSEQLHRQREAVAALAIEIDRARLASDLDLASRSRLEEMIALASDNVGDPAAGRARFSRIELLGRESLNHMRALLGLLRSVDHGARMPRPTLEQLDALLADARAGGRAVDLQIEGEHRPLAAAVELAAYRVVQHALLAVSGGRDEPTNVRLRYLDDRLELEVRGLLPEGNTAAAALLAARERITSLGGSFTANTPSPGRRVLRAQLPVVPTSG